MRESRVLPFANSAEILNPTCLVYKKRTLYLIAAALMLEAIVAVFLPSRLPRSARAIAASVNVIAAAVLCLVARQRRPDPP